MKMRMFLTALGVFAFGSLLCGLAPNLGLLISARALKGFGGGIALPIGTALLYSAFPGNERGKAMGVFGVALVAAPALGPILGGWLVDAGYWRWIFFINIPIGLIGVTLGSLLLRPDGGTGPISFDLLGLLTSAVGFGSVLYAASIAADHGWTAANVLFWFGVGALALALFAWVELKVAKEPLLDLRLFRKSTFTSAALVGYVSVIALFGPEFLMPLYLQILRGRTALEAGVLLLPLALSSAVAVPISGILFDRIGARPLLVTGFSLLAINTWQLTALTPETSIGWIQLLLALRGVALGLTVQTTFVAGLSVVPVSQTARASALINATRQVFQSLGVAVLATVLASALSPELSAQARDFQARMPAQTAEGPRVEVCQLAGPGGPVSPEAKGLISTFCSEYTTGLDNAYRLTFYFSLLAIALGATLPGWPGPRLVGQVVEAPIH